MEKPKMKKGNRQTSLEPRMNSPPVTPNRCHNIPKVANYRQAGDTRRQDQMHAKPKNVEQTTLNLRCGRFNNQPDFTKLGRPRQKSEHIKTSISTPVRCKNFKSDIVKKPTGFKIEQEKSEKKLYQHLSRSEVMHIDIRPPKNSKALSPLQSSPLMNAKYKPPKPRSPWRN